MPPISSLPLEQWNEADWTAALPYATYRANTCVPVSTAPIEIDAVAMKHVSYLVSRNLSAVRIGVLAGNPEDLLDMALRAASGVSVPHDRVVASTLLRQLTSNTSTPRSLRGRGLSLLAALHHETCIDKDYPETWNNDALYRAAWHADAAAALGFVTPAALRIADDVERCGFRRQSDCKFDGWCTARFEALTNLWRVHDRHGEQVKAEAARRATKLSKTPNAYVCAARGCGIEATHKSGLMQCSGKCRKEGKPAYCSKECQKQDWRRHKPFCKEDAPVDDIVARARQDACALPTLPRGLEYVQSRLWASEMGFSHKNERTIDLPHPTNPGETIKMASKTATPAEMKQFRDDLEKLAASTQQG